MEANFSSFDEMDKIERIEKMRLNDIAYMAGIGKGVALDPKPFFSMATALTSSPGAMHWALAGKPNADA